MKRYALALIFGGMFVLSLFVVPIVSASIALPPANPPADSPGDVKLGMPPELQIAMDETQRYFDEVLQPCLEYARLTGVGREECFRRWQEFQEGIRFFLQERGFLPNRPGLILPNGNSPGEDNSKSNSAPNENAKANANNNAAFSTDPKPQPTCLPKGTRCTLLQTSRVYLDQIYRHMFECITPDGTTYYQYDTVFTDGRETETALTKFIGESADKCIAYYATVDPVTCRILWYSQQNRCGTVTTPVYSSP